MKRMYLSCILLITYLSIYGQSVVSGKRGELSVINPSTAQFTQQTLTPINEYTGQLNLRLGLYNMDFDGLTVPLSLYYNSGGIPVNQEASWVGLGWSLSGTPSIVHIINQRSDFMVDSPSNADIPQTGYCIEPLMPSFIPSYSHPYIGELNNPDNKYRGRFLDTQPDVFIANLLDKTIKFQLTQKALTGQIEARILSASNAVISFNEPESNFTIVDENGFTYLFKRKEYSANWTQNSPEAWGAPVDDRRELWQVFGQDNPTYDHIFDRWIPTAWYVDKIISPNHKVLDYIYYGEQEKQTDEEMEDELYASVTFTRTNSSFSNTIDAIGDVQGIHLADYWDRNVASRSIQTLQIPKEIINRSTGERVLFKGSERDDIYRNINFGFGVSPGFLSNKNPLKLDEIEIFSPKGEVIKEIQLGNSYFNSTNPLTGEFPENLLRLKLDQLSIDGERHIFDYEQENSLAPKNSKDKDFWGFYNGAQNSKRYPTLDFEDYYTPMGNTIDISITGGNLGSNFEYGKIGSLTKITYPTGGYTTFDYESHTARVNRESNRLSYNTLTSNNIETGYPLASTSNPDLFTFKVGGLRIKTVTNHDANGTSILRKSYAYDNLSTTDGASEGVLMNDLLYYTFSSREYNIGTTNYAGYFDITTSNNNSLSTKNSASGSHIGYDKVETIIETVENNQESYGKILTSFINIPNETLLPISGIGPLQYATDTPPIHFEDANGQIMQQEVFDAENIPKSKIENTYDFINTSVLPGHKIYTYTSSGNFLGIPLSGDYVYLWHTYNSKRYIPLLIETRNTKYNDDGTHITKTSYNTYNTETAYLTSTRNLNSQDNFDSGHLTSYYYPYDDNFGVSGFNRMNSLVSLNRIDQPVYIRETKNDVLLNHRLITYDFINGLLLPKTERWNRIDSALENITPRITYDEYDSYGNLLKVTNQGDVSNSYIWGYENMYPVAIVSNSKVTSSQIESKIDRMILLDPSSSAVEINQQMDLLRNDPDFDASLIKSYGFNPGVGVTMIKNPNGVETNFEYDIKERLIFEKDQNGFNLSSREYNTINQTLDCVSCGRKIQLLTDSYEVLREAPVVFTRNLVAGTNGETFSGFTNFLIDYGDGVLESGSGIPTTYTHSFQDEGLYTVRLFIYKDDGVFESGQINIRVGPNADPLTNVYFDNINIDPFTGSSTMRLNGTPTAIVGVQMDVSGAISSMSGSGGFPSVVGGANADLPNSSTQLFSVEIPEGGYLNAYVRFNKSNTGSSNDCGGYAKLKIESTTIGDIGSPMSGTSIEVRDVDESCTEIIIDDSEPLDVTLSGFEGELEFDGPPGNQTCTVTYNPHVTVSGGSGNYSYSWEYKRSTSTTWIPSGDDISMTLYYNPENSIFCNPVQESFIFRCTVSDVDEEASPAIGSSSSISAMCDCDPH